MQLNVRINAENPTEELPPFSGNDHMISICRAEKESALILPSTADIRVPPYYDSMIAKLIVHARSRQEAIAENAECTG